MSELIENIVSKVFEHGRNKPNKTAVIYRQQSLDYHGLCKLVAGLSRLLQESGVKPQQMIATYLPRSIDLVVAMLAIHACRGIFVPLSVGVSNNKTAHKLQQSKIPFLLCHQSPPPFEIDALIIDIKGEPLANPAELYLEAYSEQDIAYIIFTSGSTGVPKGVKITHQALQRHIQWKNQTLPLTLDAIELQKVPLCFDVSIRELFGWIEPGNTLLIAPEGFEADPEKLCHLIEQYNCEELSIVPSLLDAFLVYLEAFNKTAKVTGLKRILVGGEVLTSATVNRFNAQLKPHNIALINLYGPAEATIEVSYYDCAERHLSNKDSVPIGRACHPDSLLICDTKDKPVVPGAIGELHIKGPQVAQGYLNIETQSQKRFYRNKDTGEKSYRTGDLVHLAKDGLLYFHGRIDQQVKINGHRVELEEIRQAFDPLICSTDVIIDTEKATNGYQILAYVRCSALLNGGPSQAEILDHLQLYLEEYLLPSQLFAVSQFPRLEAGKIDNSRLSEYVVPWPQSHNNLNWDNDKGIIERFELLATKHPNKTAIYSHEGNISYQALNDKANYIAALLIHSYQITTESIVAVLMPTGIDWVASVLAIIKSGGAYLPLSTTVPDKRNQYCLDDSKAQLLLTDTGHFKLLKATQFNIERLQYPKRQPSNPNIERHANDLIQLLYTSGSTGQPKGVLIEQAGLYHSLANKQQLNPLARSQATCLNTAITFDVSGWELFGWIYAQASLCIPAPGFESDPKTLCQLVTTHNVGELQFAPSMLHAFLQYVEQYNLGETLAKLNNIRSAGDVLKPDTVELFHRLLYQPYQIELINSYGPTEATIDTCQWTLDTNAANESVPIGIAHDGIAIYVLDEQNRLCASGTVGQLAIAGLGVARGYLNKDQQTQQKFVDDPYQSGQKMYLTGDSGLVDEQGILQFSGRSDHQIKIHGHRVELGEIEHAFYRFLPSNKVVIHPEQHGRDKKLVAYIEAEALAQSGMSIESLKVAIGDILPPYLIPSYIHKINRIPLNTNGKFDRQKLASMVNIKRPSPTDNEQDQVLLQIIQQEFDLPYMPGWDEPLSRFGVDSINIIHLISEIKRRLNIELPIAKVMRHHTVKELSGLFDQATSDRFSHLFVTYNHSGKPKLYCFPPASGYGFAYAQLAQQLPQYQLIAYHFPENTKKVAELYADHILSSHQDEDGPICMLGYSGGGNLAVAVTHKLEKAKKAVAQIQMIDAYRQHGGIEQLTPLLQELKAHMIATTIRDLSALGLKPNNINAKVNAYYSHHWLQAENIKTPICADIISINSNERDLELQLAGDPQLRNIFAANWHEATRATVTTVSGKGTHNEMLSQPYVHANAQLIAQHLLPHYQQESHS